MTEPLWTLDELVRRVSVALADPAYPSVANGRVRDVPDRRGIRWYTTIGLVDRPAGMPEHQRRFWATRPVVAEMPTPALDAVDAIDGAVRDTDTVNVLTAIQLPGGALLLLPGRPADDDVAAIRAAARPLLDLLANRGLLTPDERSPA
jgi:hypothetical protein